MGGIVARLAHQRLQGGADVRDGGNREREGEVKECAWKGEARGGGKQEQERGQRTTAHQKGKRHNPVHTIVTIATPHRQSPLSFLDSFTLSCYFTPPPIPPPTHPPSISSLISPLSSPSPLPPPIPPPTHPSISSLISPLSSPSPPSTTLLFPLPSSSTTPACSLSSIFSFTLSRYFTPPLTHCPSALHLLPGPFMGGSSSTIPSTAALVWLSAGHEQAMWCNQPVAQHNLSRVALSRARAGRVVQPARGSALPCPSNTGQPAHITALLSATFEAPQKSALPSHALLILMSHALLALTEEQNQQQQQQQQPQKQQNPQKQGQRIYGHTTVQLNAAPFVHKWASHAHQSISFHINLPIEALSLNPAGSSSRALVLLSNVLPCDGLNLTLVISTQQGDAEERHEEGTLDRRKQEERRQGDDKKGKGEEVGEGEDDVSSYDLTRLLVPLPPPPRSNSFSLPVSPASQQVTGQVPQPSPLALLMLSLEIAVGVGGGGGVRKATLRVNINTNTKMGVFPNPIPSPRFHPLSPIPSPLPDSIPSPRFHPLSPIPPPLPHSIPSPQFHPLSLIASPLPDSIPSPRFHPLSPIPSPLPLIPSPLANSIPSPRFHPLRFHPLSPIPSPLPNSIPSPRFHPLSPIPSPLPGSIPSPRSHPLSPIPSPLPDSIPSPPFHPLFPIPSPLPDSLPSPRFHPLSPIPSPLPHSIPSPPFHFSPPFHPLSPIPPPSPLFHPLSPIPPPFPPFHPPSSHRPGAQPSPTSCHPAVAILASAHTAAPAAPAASKTAAASSSDQSSCTRCEGSYNIPLREEVSTHGAGSYKILSTHTFHQSTILELDSFHPHLTRPSCHHCHDDHHNLPHCHRCDCHHSHCCSHKSEQEGGDAAAHSSSRCEASHNVQSHAESNAGGGYLRGGSEEEVHWGKTDELALMLLVR
ncbi:unnamed protein product, partial [Closterium sp. Naga37s-1]